MACTAPTSANLATDDAGDDDLAASDGATTDDLAGADLVGSSVDMAGPAKDMTGAPATDMATVSKPSLFVATGEYITYLLPVSPSGGQIFALGTASQWLGIAGAIAVPPVSIDVPSTARFIDVQGGLHQSLAIDTNGAVWTWGDSQSVGLLGDGTNNSSDKPAAITTDAAGQAFGGAARVACGRDFDLVLKTDGSVWVFGNGAGGIAGNGTAGGTLTRPSQVSFPSGTKITKILASSIGLALDSDGNVWSWGANDGNVANLGHTGDGRTPAKVALPSSVKFKDIATGGLGFNYALSTAGALYGWGQEGSYFGKTPSGSNYYLPQATPILLDVQLPLPRPVTQVAADHNTTHVILDDGSLWGWGDNVMGQVGNGTELDWSKTNPAYTWNWAKYGLMVIKPVHVKIGTTFQQLFATSPYVFYDYALGTDGKLYSWGRNKTGNLGNGVYPANSTQAAQVPNSWDVTTPTVVSPLTLTKGTPTQSPYCVANPTASVCN